MQRGERIRLKLCFGLFCGLLAMLSARLGWLQGFQAEAGRRSVARQRDRFETLPLVRGTIVDRHGRVLAYDRPVVEARAEAHARVRKGAKTVPVAFADLLSRRLCAHLMADPQRTASDRKRIRIAIRQRILRQKARAAPGGRHLITEFLVARDLDSSRVLKRLKEEQEAWNRRGSKLPGRLYVHFSRQYVRTYPDRDITAGPVGFSARQVVCNADGTPKRDFGGGVLVREVATGMESFSGLWPGAMIPEGVQPAWYPRQGQGCLRGHFVVPGRGRFFAGRSREPPAPAVLECTLDLELQRSAEAELRAASATVAKAYGSPEEWSALVLLEIQTGDVLALASHYPAKTPDGKARKATAFAPLQNVYEPGSVVKPLVVALALERGVVFSEELIDCTPTRPGNGWQVPDVRGRRVIRDDHACGQLTPHGVLVNSSNIGAVQVGLRLGRAGFEAYLKLYQFGTKTGLGLPGEQAGGRPPRSKDLDKMSDESFRRWTGPSLSFGYEFNVTAVQLARAYLSLLSGRQRQIRLVRAVTVDGRTFETPDASGRRFLSRDTVAHIRQAMVDVVSDRDGATGSGLYAMLRELGYEGSIIGGKTGTSVSDIGGIPKKTASFVGFAPTPDPKYLVVCVLRKDGADRFYGGKYAAPAVGRLLLSALGRADQQPRARKVRAFTQGLIRKGR
ncbi:MAG: peptidoglycan D,D-transpeptidase FtsI family protein [Planctomycetota bacterium]|jgi:cell division protein FtsI/penicillin-binding protein 2